MEKVVHKYENTYMIFCPGCKCGHAVNNTWTFNGDLEKPTFSPSILVKGTKDITDDEHAIIMRGEKFDPIRTVCHSFVTDGKIQFLSDCTHGLAGQTVDLEEF
jgi:hypothetical protein